MTKRVGFLSYRYHTLAAALELIPSWLRFLQTRGLIDDEQQATAVEALRPLCHEMLKRFEDYLDDPAPLRNLKLAYQLDTS